MKKEIGVAFHSKCCNAHWELVYFPQKNKYDLTCEVCDKTAGCIKVEGPILEPVCSECKDKLHGRNRRTQRKDNG